MEFFNNFYLYSNITLNIFLSFKWVFFDILNTDNCKVLVNNNFNDILYNENIFFQYRNNNIFNEFTFFQKKMSPRNVFYKNQIYFFWDVIDIQYLYFNKNRLNNQNIILNNYNIWRDNLKYNTFFCFLYIYCVDFNSFQYFNSFYYFS